MRKLLVIIILSLFFNAQILADEWNDLIEVESSIDGFCYYTKKVKTNDFYNLEFESGDYKQYNLKTEENCQDFENFQNSIKTIKPSEVHLPYNGEIIEINEVNLEIKKWKFQSGKIFRINTTKKGILIYELTTNNNNFLDVKYFDEKGVLNLHISSKANNPTKNYSFYQNKKKIFEFEEVKDKSINLIKNDLKFNNEGYYQIIQDRFDFAFIVKDNNIVSKLEHINKNNYGRISIKFFLNGKIDGMSLSIRESEFKTREYYSIDVFENSEKIFDYSIMSKKLTFETPYKNNKQHGFKYYLTWNGDQMNEKQKECYLNDIEVDKNNLKKINQCKEIKIDRKSYRNIYFNKWGVLKNKIAEKSFNFLDKLLKNSESYN